MANVVKKHSISSELSRDKLVDKDGWRTPEKELALART